MRNLSLKLSVVFILLFQFLPGQYSSLWENKVQHDNVYNTEATYESELYRNQQFGAVADPEVIEDSEVEEDGVLFKGGPPGPPDAVPIDDYLPILVVVALIIIGYIGTKKQTIET